MRHSRRARARLRMYQLRNRYWCGSHETFLLQFTEFGYYQVLQGGHKSGEPFYINTKFAKMCWQHNPG